MKKIVALFAVLLLSISSYAFVGVGLHGGVDLLTIDDLNMPAFSLNVGDVEYNYSVSREGFSNPVAFGGQVYLDLPIIPIGFEGDFDMAYAKYKWTADDHITGLNGIGDIPIEIPGYKSTNGKFSEEFTYMRMSAEVTAKYYVFSLPPVVNIMSFYIGGGVGLHFISPLVSDKVFVNELKKQTAPSAGESISIDLEELVKKNTVFGGHFVAGIKVKPPVIPIAINVDYKYTMTGENDYKDKTNKFSTIKAGLSLYF